MPSYSASATSTLADKRTSRIYAHVVERMGPAYADWANTELAFAAAAQFARGETVLGKGKYSVVYDCAVRARGGGGAATAGGGGFGFGFGLGFLADQWARLFPPPEAPESDVEQDDAAPATTQLQQRPFLNALAQLSLYASSSLHLNTAAQNTRAGSSSPSTPTTPNTSPHKPPLPPHMLSTSTPKRSFSVSSSSSSVQSAATVTPTKQYVVKLFRPDKTLKLKREILILKHLADGPNIIRFVDVILDPETGSPGIVLERVGNTDWKEFYANMGYQDVRFWIRELCRALAFTHQHGIIHRDVKPQNICIDPIARKLTLIDYGLADFYVPGKELNLRVASRFYKPPEILVGNRYYDYSFDMWSVGCILAGIIFKKDVFFKGEDDLDQLRQIVHVLGRRALHQYLGEYNLSPRLPQDLLVTEDSISASNHSMSSSTMATSSSASTSISPSYKQDPIEWFEFVDWGNGETARDMALQVVGGLLVFDHRERWTAEECLQHPFFRDLEESSPEVEVEEEEILVDVAPNVREDGVTLNSRVSDVSLDSSEGEVVVVKE